MIQIVKCQTQDFCHRIQEANSSVTKSIIISHDMGGTDIMRDFLSTLIVIIIT